MVTQPKLKPLQPSAFFADGMSARPVVPGTVARGQLRLNPPFDTGEIGGKLVSYVPLRGFAPNESIDPDAARQARAETLARGRERFDIYCSPCHDRTGNGNGIIVQRGFTRPPSFLDDRLREAPPGHFFKVITHGHGAMYSYAARVAPADRWAIVTYVRALQLRADPAITLGRSKETGSGRLRPVPVTFERERGPARGKGTGTSEDLGASPLSSGLGPMTGQPLSQPTAAARIADAGPDRPREGPTR